MQNTDTLDFKTGDIIKVFTKDAAGSKIHATPFEGVVISLHGQKSSRTFTVRKVASSQVAVERIFPMNSPAIEKIQIVKKGNARRAKLYFKRAKTKTSGRG